MTTYVTGVYHLHLFGADLKKIKTINHDAFIPAREEGENLIQRPPYASYVVTRVITNSNDRALPWTHSVSEEYRDGYIDPDDLCSSRPDDRSEASIFERFLVLPEERGGPEDTSLGKRTEKCPQHDRGDE